METSEALGSVVVVIDTDPEVLTTLSSRLEEAGFPAITARSPAEGLEAVSYHRPKVVVVSEAVAKASDYKFCRAIRSTHAVQDAFVIVLSEWKTAGGQLGAIDAGADLYLDKRQGQVEAVAIVSDVFAGTGKHESTRGALPPKRN